MAQLSDKHGNLYQKQHKDVHICLLLEISHTGAKIWMGLGPVAYDFRRPFHIIISINLPKRP